MDLSARVVALLGTLLLAASALAALWGLGLVASIVRTGPTEPRVVAAMAAFGLAMGCGLTGVVACKWAAGSLLPSDVDLSVGFRGGQGGL